METWDTLCIGKKHKVTDIFTKIHIIIQHKYEIIKYRKLSINIVKEKQENIPSAMQTMKYFQNS